MKIDQKSLKIIKNWLKSANNDQVTRKTVENWMKHALTHIKMKKMHQKSRENVEKYLCGKWPKFGKEPLKLGKKIG